MALRDSIRTRFNTHPASVGETYGEHFASAMGFSAMLFRAALVCAVHAVMPFLFEKTGSRYIDELHRRMVTQRGRDGDAPSPDAVNSGA